jgi:hypothetical protein
VRFGNRRPFYGGEDVNMQYSDFYDDLAALEFVIDWELMKSKFWFDREDDPNRKCRRQAEFLIHQFCPWTLIEEIGVIRAC